MLGIFITGPIGFAVGLLWGLWRKARRPKQAGGGGSAP
jgi:hypothetical protein